MLRPRGESLHGAGGTMLGSIIQWVASVQGLGAWTALTLPQGTDFALCNRDGIDLFGPLHALNPTASQQDPPSPHPPIHHLGVQEV